MGLVTLLVFNMFPGGQGKKFSKCWAGLYYSSDSSARVEQLSKDNSLYTLHLLTNMLQ
jgi:hypothetical protein